MVYDPRERRIRVRGELKLNISVARELLHEKHETDSRLVREVHELVSCVHGHRKSVAYVNEGSARSREDNVVALDLILT